MDMAVALKISAGVTGQQAVDQLRTSIERLNGSAVSLRNVFKVLGGAAVFTGFVGLIKGAIDTGDKLNDLSQKTGIAVEDLDALGFAAELNGSNLEQVSGALGKLSKNMAEAAGGGKEAIGVFRQFGISQGELKSGSVTLTDAMARIADKIAAMPDGWQKTAAAQKAFGKSAADIIPLLNAGGDAIRNARAQLEGYGALFTGGFAQAADDFNDKMALMRRMSGALGLSIARELLPVMSGFMQGLIDTKTRVGDVAGDTSLSDWASVAAQGVAVLIDVLKVAAQGIYALVGSFQAVWADIKLAGTFLGGGAGLNPFSAENKKILSDALAERNKTVEEANQRYSTLWTMNGSATYDAVKKQMAGIKSAIAAASGAGEKRKSVGGGFDFSAGKESEFDKIKQQLEEQLAKTGELNKMQEISSILQTKRFADLSTAQREQLINLAKEIDSKAALQKIEELRSKETGNIAMLELEGQRANMTAREYEKLVEAKRHELEVSEATRRMNEQDAQAYRQVADELFRNRQSVEDLNYANQRTFGAGASRAFNEYIEGVKDIAKTTHDLFTKAFGGIEDALVNFVMTGKLSFKSLATSILADMARILIQQQIMAPLMAATSSFFGFADGGVMTSGGPLPLNKYANGGIASSPQVALFGEGRQPEAYVPLPDGRTIPVTMQGGNGGSTSVVVNVNVESGQSKVESNNGAGELGRLIAGVVRAELVNQKRPGGLLAA